MSYYADAGILPSPDRWRGAAASPPLVSTQQQPIHQHIAAVILPASGPVHTAAVHTPPPPSTLRRSAVHACTVHQSASRTRRHSCGCRSSLAVSRRRGGADCTVIVPALSQRRSLRTGPVIPRQTQTDTDRQTDRRADRHRQTDRQTDKHAVPTGSWRQHHAGLPAVAAVTAAAVAAAAVHCHRDPRLMPIATQSLHCHTGSVLF